MSGAYVRLRAGGEHYAIPVAGVREIARIGRITPVPGAPVAVLGVWNLRGDVMAVLDLAIALGLAGAEPSRIVVVEEGNLHGGLAVEAVTGVDSLPQPLEPVESKHLLGAALVERVPVGVIDLEEILTTAGAGVIDE